VLAFFETSRVISWKKHSSASVYTFPPNSSVGRAPSFRRRGRAGTCASKHGPLALALKLLAMGTLSLGALTLVAQTTSKQSAKPSAGANKIAVVKSFRLVQEKNGPAVEILSTQPLVPAIQLINDPTRLVIDLPNARLDAPQKRFSIQADQIIALRANQFQENPPVVRVVVDLLVPREYTWDAAGNRLVVHLGKTLGEASHPLEPQPVASVAPATQPVVKEIRAAGPLAIVADTGNVGASFTAGADTAVLRLSSGGELRVCPGTTVSITPSQSRHNLMLGMNTGALEAHMSLDASTDSVMTPDFRIALVGPGEFHYAFSADHQGNTCVRALPGNTASAIVTELLGDRTYQVRATDQLVFRSGQLDRVDTAVPLECGCPPPQSTQRATNDLPVQSSAPSEARPPASSDSPPLPETPHATGETPHPQMMPATPVPAADSPHASAEPSSDNQLHVQVTAPLVFRATGPPPAPVEDVQALPIDSRHVDAPELSVASAPPAASAAKPVGTEKASASPPPRRGFFRRLGGFFAALFR